MNPQRTTLPIALTMGDPAGIGPELALKAWAARKPDDAPFFLIAAPEPLRALARRLSIDAPIAEGLPEEAAAVFPTALPVVALTHDADAEPGRSTSRHAAATLEAIARAVDYVRAGEARAVVTNPIAKSALYAAGFRFPGHTEFLGELAKAWGGAAQPVMMIWSEALAVVPVTVHIALAEAPRAADPGAHRLDGAHRRQGHAGTVRRSRGRGSPSPGLNPHAGEGGAMGREEIETIAPAIATLRAEGLDVAGPLPADTMFHAQARARYDVALTMYHDQGLIPVKTLAFDTGVNVTLGLPFVRTSPDHGTAFDIAGKGLANPSSLIAALRLADWLTR